MSDADPKQAYDVIVAGHVCLDVTPEFPDTGGTDIAELLTPGKLVSIDGAVFSSGGPVSNTGLPLIRLGVKTGLMGKIGDDFFGSCLRAIFREWEADKALTVVAGARTSFTVVLAPPGIDRIFLHHTGANDTFGPEDVNYDLVATSRLLHLGYPPIMKRMFENDGRELTAIYRRAKETGATTSLDMSLPDPDSPSGRANWATVLAGLLPHVDIAPFSAEEAMFMLNRSRFDELKAQAGAADPVQHYTVEDMSWLGRRLLELGAPIVLLKCGTRGLVLFTASAERVGAIGRAAPADTDAWADRMLWRPAFLVEKVASATGSGDSAIAGFLAALLRGCGPEDALATACCTGAQNVKVLDAVSGIGTWDETQAMIADWPQREAQTGGGWAWDESGRFLRGPEDGKGRPRR